MIEYTDTSPEIISPLTEPIQRPLGELALRPQAPEHLFGVSEEELIALCPSVIPARQAFKETIIALNPQDTRLKELVATPDSEESAVDTTNGNTEDQVDTQYTRGDLRMARSSNYRTQFARTMQTGAQFVASFPDQEEGIAEGRKIIIEEVDEALGHMFTKRIVPGSLPLRKLNEVAKDTADEIARVAHNTDPESIYDRYTVLKALGYNRLEDLPDQERKARRRQEIEPEYILSMMQVFGKGDSHKALIEEMQAGSFDSFIARDILTFVLRADQVQGDLAKVKQLAQFAHKMSGSPHDIAGFYNTMVDNLDSWPDAYRQIIIESRHVLRERLETRLSKLAVAARKDDMLIENPREAFEQAFSELGEAFIQRLPVTPENKFELMKLRAQLSSAKRGRIQSSRDQRRAARRANYEDSRESEAPEERSEKPATLVTCNFNTHTTSETTDEIVTTFVDKVSQGNEGVIRNDITRVLTFMARRDLPPEHNRGVKLIKGTGVRFGTDSEGEAIIWRLFEMKPTDAAGLPLRSGVVKNSRVYFIKMPDSTIGIVGIEPRADQETFLRSIRSKIKERG